MSRIYPHEINDNVNEPLQNSSVKIALDSTIIECETIDKKNALQSVRSAWMKGMVATSGTTKTDRFWNDSADFHKLREKVREFVL